MNSPVLLAAIHSAIGLIGGVLLYVALFLSETEEGKLQNRLEKLWVDINDLSRKALTKQAAFLQQISAIANSGLNRLFGKGLLSAEAIAASLCFSLTSILMFVTYFATQLTSWPGGPDFSLLAFILFLASSVTFLIGFLGTPFRYLAFLWIPACFYFFAGFNVRTKVFDWNPFELSSVNAVMLRLLTVLGAGFICDVVFIAVSRWCLRKASKLKSGWKIAMLLTLSGSIGLALVSPILLVLHTLVEHKALSEAEMDLEFVGVSNVVAGTFSIFFILVAVVAFVHLAIWPILERPIYSLQRFGVARNPKLLTAASATCLLFAWPNNPIIQMITKLVHD
jgi:hypothetical protein